MTALKDHLADPENPVSFFVELDYRNPATDIESTLRITDKLIAAGDVPAGYLWGLLGPDEDNPAVGPGGRYVAAEAEEAGGILQAAAERIVLSNPPPSIGADGPLDFLRDLTLSGRPVKVYGGDPSFPPPGTPWWTHLGFDGNDFADVGDFCDVGAASSFFLLIRFSTSAAGGADHILAAKRSTPAGYQIKLNSTGIAEALVRDGTGGALSAVGTAAGNLRDGEEHVVVQVLDRGATEGRVYVDGVEAGAIATTGLGSLANALALRFGSRSDGVSFFSGDLIEAAWGLRVPTDAEIAAWVDRPLDPVADNCVLWRVNDGSGSTVAAAASAQALTDSGAAVLSDLNAAITGATWGEATEDDFPWGQFGSGIAEDEPEFDSEGNTVALRLKSALGILDQDLDVKSYVGEPSALKMLTSTGVATSANNAAHHLTEFTLAGRFWHPTAGAVIRTLSRRLSSGTATNWQVRFPANGKINAIYSSGGVEAALSLTSTANYDDGETHWWGFARRSGHAYLMIDGAVVAETSTPPTPDLPTAGVSQGVNFHGPGAIFDHRILNHYIAPDELRAWVAVRSTGTEQGLVGLWRGDDNGGNTLTDYSATAAHATIAGVENTAFKWVSSDLGTPELAGNSMMAVIGSVWHFLCDLVDGFRERWRVADRTPPYGGNVSTVRDEGELLAETTDYTIEGEEVVELAAEAGEPLTAGIDALTEAQPTQVLREILVDRGPLDLAAIDVHRLQSVYSNYLGIATRRASIRELLAGGEWGLLPGMLAYATLRRDAVLAVDAMLPPVAPSPRDGACLEFIGEQTSDFTDNSAAVTWATVDPLGTSRDFTLAAFVKIHRLGPSASGLGGFIVMDLTGNSDPTGPGLEFYLDLSFGVPRLILRQLGFGESKSTGYGNALDFGWHFLAVVHDDTGGTCKFYAGLPGGTVRLLATTTDFGFWSGGASYSDGVRIGSGYVRPRFRGSCFEPSAWSAVRTLAQLQAQMDDGLVGNEAGLGFYAPLDGLSASSLTDSISTDLGAVVGDVVARPDLTLDLRVTPRPWNEKRLRPARRIDVRYRRNFARLDPGQIATAVPQDQRQDLQTDYRTEPWPSPEIAADYKDARDVIIGSPWAYRDGAQATMRLARYRYAEGRYFAALGRRPGNPLRQGLLLETGDEVRVYGHGDLVAGPVYRVASNRASFNDLDCELGLLR